MENFNKFLAEEEDASQMPADASTGLPKPVNKLSAPNFASEAEDFLEFVEYVKGKLSNIDMKLLNQKNPKIIYDELMKDEKIDTYNLHDVFELSEVEEEFRETFVIELANYVRDIIEEVE
tara:strand:+ start:119 stop:478 length:360 start_codon:yes stop_codon:yes gene_type:complete